MRHIVTGGSGFVGSRLVAALRERGDHVVVYDLAAPAAADTEWIAGDIRSPAELARLGLGPEDVVHHLAARQFHGPVPRRGRDGWFSEVNAGGTATLLAAMRSGGANRIIYFSTDMTYGPPSVSPVPPSHPQMPIGPYGRSKLRAERLIGAAATDSGLQATIFRPRLIAGSGRLGILARLFSLIAHNLPVPMIGAGTNRYQMIAVEDCVAAALKAVDQGFPAGPFNLGSESPPTVRALLADLIQRAGSFSPLIPTPARAVQAVLGTLDRLGLTLLYPEQFAIANCDSLLDTATTETALGWRPARRDQDIVFDAYRHFQALRTLKPSLARPESSNGVVISEQSPHR